MNEFKEYKQLGSYGVVVNDGKILLIKKSGGPYDSKLDLPGGTIEFNEKPSNALIREFKEEVGIDIKKYELYDADSVSFDWHFKDKLIKVYHMGVFYKVIDYDNNIKKDIKIDEVNDDSLGADFYEINKLKKNELSAIAVLELEKMGYNLK